jgi:hypothetical protein
MTRQKATKESWKTIDMSAIREKLDLDFRCTREEYEQILQGFIPTDMEDKWFLYVEGNTLYVHRSWTGHCLFMVTFREENQKYLVEDAWMNTDPQVCHPPMESQYGKKLVIYLLERILLDKDVSLPMPQSFGGKRITTPHEKLMYHHGLMGHSRSQREKRADQQHIHHFSPSCKHYESEEEELLDMFGFHQHGLATMSNDHPEVALVQKMQQWLTTHSFDHDIRLRYILVGLHRYITGMRSTTRRSQSYKTFAQALEKFCTIAPVKRHFELFERYYGKPLESFEEYEHLFTAKEDLDGVTGDQLFTFVVEGKKLCDTTQDI